MVSSIIPTLIGLDTSVLCYLAADLSNSAHSRRQRGESFLDEMSSRGWVPAISFENILELFQSRDFEVVRSRVSMFARIPKIAHVDSLQCPGFPGGIGDILAREVSAFLVAKGGDVFSIQRSVAGSLFAFCDGKQIAECLRRDMRSLWRGILQWHTRRKLVSSVSHVDVMGAGHRKIGELRADRRIDRAAIARHRRNLTRFMQTELRARGVKGVDHGSFAEEFALGTEARLLAAAGSKGYITCNEFANETLRDNGIAPSLVNDNLTVNELAALVAFNHKLKVVSRALRFRRQVTASEIPVEVCPSEIVQRGLERQRRSAPRAESGDVVDSYLAVLACYCDMLVVDKRTREYLRQLRARDDAANKLLRKVICLSRYTDLLSEEL